MRTTLDLPEALVRELERRARQGGQELAQAASELLWKGLATCPAEAELPTRATLKVHATTGLPYIECVHTAPPGAEMTPERVADVLIEQEATWQHEVGR